MLVHLLTWEFMTIDIDFLMFSEFFWYVLLFWGFFDVWVMTIAVVGSPREDNRAALGHALLLDPQRKDDAIRCTHLEILQKSWRANDGCPWSNQLNTSHGSRNS